MTFFCHFPKKCLHFPQKCHLSPKISEDLIFSHRPFSYFNVAFSLGGQIPSRHLDRGVGQNPYISPNSQYYHYSFFPRGGGGQTPLPTSMGAWPDLPPPGSITVYKPAFLNV